LLGIAFTIGMLVLYEVAIVPYLVSEFSCEQLANNFHKELAVEEYAERCE
jgi:hypothetical protein